MMTLYGDNPGRMDPPEKRTLCLPLEDNDFDQNQECPSAELEAQETGRSGKRKRADVAGLSTPDVASLAVSTPELEDILISGQHAFFVNNSPAMTRTSCGSGRSGSYLEQQLRFSQGFVDALQALQSSKSASSTEERADVPLSTGNVPHSHRPASGSVSGEGSMVQDYEEDYQNESDDSEDKVEAGNSSMPTWNSEATPISRGNPQGFNWDTRNPAKLDSSTVAKMNPNERAAYRAARKRARNRLAASRCREKKLKRQSDLEDTVKALMDQNTALRTQAFGLREDMYKLKEEVVRHAQSGCPTILLELSVFSARSNQKGTN